MLTFDHITETTYETKPANLPVGAKLTEVSVKGKTVWKVHQTESLTVPLTSAELAAIGQSDTAEVEMSLGIGNKAKMTQACADYIRGRKLRSNQEKQAELRGDGKATTRQAALAWFLQTPTNIGVYTAKLASGTPKEISAWLDTVYSDNKSEVDTYASK